MSIKVKSIAWRAMGHRRE